MTEQEKQEFWNEVWLITSNLYNHWGDHVFGLYDEGSDEYEEIEELIADYEKIGPLFDEFFNKI